HDGHEQEAEVAVEGEELTDREPPLEDAPAAHPHDGQGPEAGEEEDEGEVPGDGVDDAEVQVADLVVHLLEAGRLARLPREGAHDLEPLQVLLEDRVQAAE